MTGKFKPWLVLAVIFVAGVLSGAALTMVLAPHFLHPRMRPHDPAHLEQDMMAGLTRELSLTPDQQAKIQPIVKETARQLHDVHVEEVGRVSNIIRQANEQITPILTPGQKTQLDKLIAEGGNTFPGRGRGWGGPGFHGGAPQGGPPPPEPPPGPPGSAPPPPNPSPPGK